MCERQRKSVREKDRESGKWGVGPVELDWYGVTLLKVDGTTLMSNTLIIGGWTSCL